MKKLFFICLLAFVCTYQTAQAQEQYIGEIRLFAGTYAPRGWAICDGRLMPIAQNSALFSILGTTYGGDGKTTFALPDLRGKVPVGASREVPVGSKLDERTAQKNLLPKDAVKIVPQITLNYIIAVVGIYPPRD